MFDRFSDECKQAMNLARQAAQELRHDWFGPEHMLLGVIGVESSTARQVVEALGLDPDEVRAEVRRLFPRSSAEPAAGQLPFTEGAKRALERCMAEAQLLNLRSIGTGPLLLSLMADESLRPALGEASIELARASVTGLHAEEHGEDAAPPSHAPGGLPPGAGSASARVVAAALDEARRAGAHEMRPEHFLMALAGDEGPVGEVLREAGLDLEFLRERFRQGDPPE